MAEPGRLPTGELPAPPTPLVGRERERAAVTALLLRADVRLLTLTGAGGVGKTRLAIAVAADLAPEGTAGVAADPVAHRPDPAARRTDRPAVASPFRDGVCFVDLSPVTDAALAPSAIARALAVNEAAQRPLTEGLVEQLRGRSLLLVLDNVEQVLQVGPVVAGLLAACPGLKVLATSRAPLHLSGEHEFPAPPLALPDPARLPDLETLSTTEAVTLFVQRARAARPDFMLTEANAPAVAELCVRLDGLPLAIELAAARIKLLSPPALLARLSHRLGVLTGGAQDLPSRQRTLRSTMDWSYELLDPAERALFARLGVFAGGCSLEAVEAIAAMDTTAGAAVDTAPGQPAAPELDVPDLDVLDGLARLVDRSLLLRVDGADDEPRFAMLETIREYAAERFAASPDAPLVRQQHAAYFLALAEQAARELAGQRQGVWLARLGRDHDNLRAALDWALQQSEADLGLRLAAALGPFWEMRGYLSEGQGRLERALACWPDAQTPARADVLTAAGALAYLRGDLPRSAALHEESLTLRRALADEHGIARSLHHLGRVAHYRGEGERAAALYAESLALYRALGDRRGVARSLNGSGVLARNRGDLDGARTLYAESLGLFRALGDTWGTALLLNNLARVERDQELWERASALCSESLTRFGELGDRHGIAWVLSNLVVIAQRRGAHAWAARLHGAAERLRESVGTTALSLSPGERAAYDTAVDAARSALGVEAFAAEVADGRAQSPEQVAASAPWSAGEAAHALAADASPTSRTAVASSASGAHQPEPTPNPLTRREREVAALVAQGLTDRQIAETLVIAEGTVGVHLTNIFTKLDLHARSQLAAWAVERGLARSS